MPNSIRDGDFKKKFEPTYLEEKKKIKNSDYFSQMLTNDIFNLSQSEQLSVNIKVGLVFWQLQRSSNAIYSRVYIYMLHFTAPRQKIGRAASKNVTIF